MSGWRLKIAHKLPLALIGSALIACLCVGAGSYFVADRSVAGLTQEKMETMAQERARELGDYFAAAKEDLLVSAGSSNTVTALKGMKMGWAQMVENQGSQLIDLYVTNNPFGENERQLFDQSESLASYNRTHGRYHPGFRNQAATRGYDDVYLFDVEGNLLYSVMKRADYGANVAADPAWSVTPLGQAFRAAVGLTEPGSIVFIDSLPYLGTAGASFVAAPVFEGNDLSGVLAFELSPTRVAAILDTRLGLGETGETFLVGIDHLFRNDSPFSAENDVRQSAYKAGIVDAAFASGRVVSGWESGYRGMDMLASAAPLSFEGTDWVLVAALGEGEAMAAVDRMSAMIIAITGCVLIIAAGLGYLFSQSIARPITRLTRSMNQLAEGDLDAEVKGGNRGDELGAMARAVEVFRENAARVREMTEDERLSSEQRRDERAGMMQSLLAGFGDVVDAAVAGDFSRRVTANFDDPELNSLARSVNNLVETVEQGLGQSVAVLGALAHADLTGRVEGDFQGAFGQLRDDLNMVGERLTATITGLRQTSRTLKTATGEILSGANDLSDRTTQQAATIEETSSAIEQLSATVGENARRAAEASLKAKSVSETATEGGEVVRRANEAMERITTSSSKISSIIGVIDDIAFQTNLLALNASVEAARAGEAGKGFAVVAVEVRRLAQSAAKASSEVKGLIEQSGTEVRTRLEARRRSGRQAARDACRGAREQCADRRHRQGEQGTGIGHRGGVVGGAHPRHDDPAQRGPCRRDQRVARAGRGASHRARPDRR